MNYAAIYEMNSDMVNFKIKAKKDTDLQQLDVETYSPKRKSSIIK